MKKNQTLKYLLYVAILVIAGGLAIWSIAKNNFNEVIKVISASDKNIIVLMLLIMVVTFMLDGLNIRIFARLSKKDYRWKQGTYNGLIGTFFNGITPSATGGQFVQAYTFSRQGIPIAKSASILLMNFITHQMAMVIFCLITMILRFDVAYHEVKWNGLNLIHLSLIGFGINATVIAALYFAAYSRFFHNLLTKHLVNFLSFIKIVRKNKKEKFRTNLESQIRNFKAEATKLQKNLKVLFSVLLIHTLRLTCIYAVPFFALKAVGANIGVNDFLTILCFTSFVSLITSFFPLPGASGGAEVMFATFFAFLFPGGSTDPTLAAAMLLWRIVSFYFGLIIGGCVFFFYRESGKKVIKMVDDPVKLYETIKLEKVIVDGGQPKVVFKETQIEEKEEYDDEDQEIKE